MDEPDLIELAEIIRSALRARTADAHLIEDVTQETMLRVATAQMELEPASLRAYAIVTARNTLNSHFRKEGVARRHAHRVVDYTTLGGGEELTLEREENNALARALGALEATDRQLLLDHEVNDMSIGVLADRDQTSHGAIAMRLARARAALRVEFLLVFRHVTLPTSRCRQVLLALSAGDRRRQRILAAADHLVVCATCSQLCEPLVQRRRGAAAWWFIPVPQALRSWWRTLRTSRVGRGVALGSAVAIAVATVVVAGRHSSGPPVQAARPSPVATSVLVSPPSPSTAPVVVTTASPVATTGVAAASSVSSAPTSSTPASTDPETTPTLPPAPCPRDVGALTVDQAGCHVVLEGLAVTGQPTVQGFWVRYFDGRPLWVHLLDDGSPVQRVDADDTVTVTATVRSAGEQSTSGVPAQQAVRLTDRGIFLEANVTDVIVNPPSIPPTP